MNEHIWRYSPRFEPAGYSPLVTYARSIENAERLPVIEQSAFAFGNPGTEAGHSLDPINTNRTVEVDGQGNYQFFLRQELANSIPNANADLTQAFRLQASYNAGAYFDVNGTSTYVRSIDNVNIVDDAATTNRLASSANPFTAGGYDESDGLTSSVTWDPGVGVQHTEMLWSLEVVDADMAPGDTLAFRVVHDDGALIDTYTVTATLNWNAGVVQYNESVSDGVEGGDLVTEVSGFTDGLSDQSVAGDSADNRISGFGVFTDGASAGDLSIPSTANSETLVDGVVAQDVLTPTTGLLNEAEDGVMAGDIPSGSVTAATVKWLVVRTYNDIQ